MKFTTGEDNFLGGGGGSTTDPNIRIVPVVTDVSFEMTYTEEGVPDKLLCHLTKAYITVPQTTIGQYESTGTDKIKHAEVSEDDVANAPAPDRESFKVETGRGSSGVQKLQKQVIELAFHSNEHTVTEYDGRMSSPVKE